MRLLPSLRLPILVLGDWYVDEDWVLAAHESRRASVVGKGNFRAVGDPSARARNLGGAGLIARLLFWYGRFDQEAEFIDSPTAPRFDVYALGTWAEADGSLLHQMCHPYPLKRLNPFTLTFTSELDEEKKRQLDGLTLVPLPHRCQPADGGVGTARVFRLYRYLEGDLELNWRIDFETGRRSEPSEELEEAHKESGKAYEKSVCSILQTLSKTAKGRSRDERLIGSSHSPLELPFRYAVIEEVKGINEPVFRCLHKEGLIDKKTLWFMYTKEHPALWWQTWRSEWGKVRLWVLRPKSLLKPPGGDEAMPQPVQWFVEARQPSADAINVLDALLQRGTEERFLDERRTVVAILPRGLQCLAVCRWTRDAGGLEPPIGYYNTESDLRPLEEQLAGRETCIFTTFARGLMLEDLDRKSDRTGSEATDSKRLIADYIDTAVELGRLYLGAHADELEDLEEGGSFKGLNFDPSLAAPGKFYKQTSFPWDRCRSDWRAAFQGTGTVRGPNGERCLQIWRAMGELPGYVETVDARRREIARLRSELAELKESFARGRHEHASALLLASPGSGKTFLAKKLQASLSMPLHSFNIVQLVTRENVLQCFNSISSGQAGNPGQLHLVVFDEINAKLQGSFVYDLFLSALESGTYNWHGRPYKLQPCAWLFLGTRVPEPQESEKAADFCSRLSMGEFHLDVPLSSEQKRISYALEEQIRLGFVYRGALLLQKKNPDVQRVSAEVLRAFHALPLDTSVRELDHLASRFSDVRYGEVRRRSMPSRLHQVLEGNCTDVWTTTLGEGRSDGSVDLDRELVLIETEPRPCPASRLPTASAIAGG